MKHLLLLPLILSACALPLSRTAPAPSEPVLTPDTDTTRPLPRPDARAAPLGTSGARTAATLDQTTPAQRAAAVAPPATGARVLGETLAALGSPTEQGFWLRTGLVERVQQGRVELAGGRSVAVELRPSGQPAGAGSQLSLAAFRALEVPLTQLVTVRVLGE
jgi:hypothetical protein